MQNNQFQERLFLYIYKVSDWDLHEKVETWIFGNKGIPTRRKFKIDCVFWSSLNLGSTERHVSLEVFSEYFIDPRETTVTKKTDTQKLKRIIYLNIYLKFLLIQKLSTFLGFWEVCKFSPNFFKVIEKTDLIQEGWKIKYFREKGSPLIKKGPNFVKKTLFLLIKIENDLLSTWKEVKKIWPATGFEHATCGFLTAVAPTHMNYSSH